MKKLLLFLGCGLALNVSAQKIDYDIDVKPTDFPQFQKRKLLVQIMEEDKAAVTKIQRWGTEDPDWKSRYSTFIRKYNENIKMAVEKFWTLSSAIEFKTKKEIDEIFKKRDRNYVVLTPREANADNDGLLTRDKASGTMLVFTRPDKGESDIFYRVPLAHSFHRVTGDNPYADYVFSIRFAIEHINYMNEKREIIDFEDFVEKQAREGCKSLNSKKVMVDKDMLDKSMDKKAVKGAYKKKGGVEFVDFGVIDEAIKAGRDDVAYTVSIPMSFFKSTMNMGAKPNVVCMKMIVDVSTGKILAYYKNKPKAGVDNSSLQEKDFEEWNSCE